MVTIISLIVFAASILMAGKMIQAIRFSIYLKKLFAGAKTRSRIIFKYSQLVGLPEPVQLYFKNVLKEGQPYADYVRLSHDGEFKVSEKGKWIDIKGEQYFTTEPAGFIWRGTTRFFRALDMYVSGKGRLIVSTSIFNIVNGQGEKYDQGELLRWLGESVWFPTNLLPSKYIHWLPIDKWTSKLELNYKGKLVSYIVSFNDDYEITQLETKRY